ncbi:hypothetical protein AHAS_Ahas20G0127400 [Arachis hypogaea]
MVFGSRGLVSMVVQSCVEEVVHKHMVGLVGCHEKVHHNYCLGMHNRMVVSYSALEGVVAKRVDQILVTHSICDCFDLDACSCYSFHSFQQYSNQTQSDGVRTHSN